VQTKPKSETNYSQQDGLISRFLRTYGRSIDDYMPGSIALMSTLAGSVMAANLDISEASQLEKYAMGYALGLIGGIVLGTAYHERKAIQNRLRNIRPIHDRQ